MKRVRLTESQFNKLVSKCVKKALNEDMINESSAEYMFHQYYTEGIVGIQHLLSVIDYVVDDKETISKIRKAYDELRLLLWDVVLQVPKKPM